EEHDERELGPLLLLLENPAQLDQPVVKQLAGEQRGADSRRHRTRELRNVIDEVEASADLVARDTSEPAILPAPHEHEDAAVELVALARFVLSALAGFGRGGLGSVHVHRLLSGMREREGETIDGRRRARGP